jgi:hypothetical protein
MQFSYMTRIGRLCLEHALPARATWAISSPRRSRPCWIQVVVVFSDSTRASAVTVNAHTGRVLWQGPLPGPVTHVQEVAPPEDTPAAFLMAALPPQGGAAAAFVFPEGANVTWRSDQLHFWDLDASSGAHRFRCSHDSFM